ARSRRDGEFTIRHPMADDGTGQRSRDGLAEFFQHLVHERPLDWRRIQALGLPAELGYRLLGAPDPNIDADSRRERELRTLSAVHNEWQAAQGQLCGR